MSLSVVLGLFVLAAGSSATIPQSFHGRWDLKSVDCTDFESLGAIEISADRIDYWEAGDEIISVQVERADIIKLKARRYDANSDDSEKAPVVSLRLALVDGGKRLKYQVKGYPLNKFSTCSGARPIP